MQEEGTGRKVLVVDDKPEFILLVQKVLKHGGMRSSGLVMVKRLFASLRLSFLT